MSDPGNLESAAVDLLRQLIRFNTVNPPGGEAAAQHFIKGELEEAGFAVELFCRDGDETRPNLVAELPAATAAQAADGPAVALLGHIDTVLAEPSEWRHDPWSGEIAEECVWGRGAQDMKGQVAAELAAAVSLAREGWRPASGVLKIIVTADEEAGGNHGARWLCEELPGKVRADYVINEGGGQMFNFEGRRYFRVGCAEKGFCRFNVVTHGKAGHASLPRMGVNALLKLAPLLERLAGGQPGYDLTAEPKAILKALFGVDAENDDVPELMARIEQADPRLAVLLEPTFGVTLTPTIARAGEKVNVIPALASVRVDCRVPPGFGAELAERRAREVLGEGDYELEFGEHAVGNASAHDTPLMDAIVDWVARTDPSAVAVPSVLPGFTDSRWFRDAFPDCVAYGFFPQSAMDMYESDPLIHGADERIPVADLALAAGFYREIIPKLLG